MLRRPPELAASVPILAPWIVLPTMPIAALICGCTVSVSVTYLGTLKPWQSGAAPRLRQQWSVPMITRRLAWLAPLSFFLQLHGIGVSSAQAQNAPPDSAAAFIKEMVARLTAVVNAPGNNDAVGQKLQTIVDSSVDVGRIAQFCLGRFWRSTALPQQQEYLALFHRVLLNSITGNIKVIRESS